MSKYLKHLIVLLKKVGIAFLLFTICRILFFAFNYNHFNTVSIGSFFYGLRFDTVAISFLFAPIIVLQLAPFPFRNFSWYQRTVNIIFYAILTIATLLNLADVAYFDYTLKRTTADVFGMMSEGDDFLTLLPTYVADFWYAFVLLGLLIFIAIYINKKFNKLYINYKPYRLKDYTIHLSIFIATAGLLILGMRGGLQYKPLSIVNAGQYAPAQNVPVVLNTPFTIMKTLNANKLERINYFTEEELKAIYTPEKQMSGIAGFEEKNVVIIILESFAKEYIGALNNGKGYTPFLDSLIGESYVYNKAYANGQRSIESLPCILSGIPQLMSSSFIISNYASNKVDGLPKLLKNHGYNTSFYHGGANGTMGFNGFVGSMGIDDYFGMDEYPNEKIATDYDGLWGIFDEPYLKYFGNELNQKKEPFFSTVFTISSHHPFTIPKEHFGRFPKGTMPVHETIGYADYSLKQFFNSIKSMPWFNNTLFVLTADHSSHSETAYYNSRLNRFAIPSLIYDPTGKIKGTDSSYFEQIDITPTLLDLLNISDSIITFGNSSYSSEKDGVINYINGNYQYAFNDYFLIFNGEKTTDLYNVLNDSLLTKNIIDSLSPIETSIKEQGENQVKAIIQQYNNRIINNQLSKSN